MVAGRDGEVEQQLRFVTTGRIDREGANVQEPSAAKRTRLMTSSGLHGRRMRVTSTDSGGVVSGETILEFEQTSDVVSARYRGGTIIDGYLVGNLDPTGTSLRFCYVQVDLRGNVDAGASTGTIDQMQDGRLRLIEEFQWFTRSGRGTNVFEEIRDTVGSSDLL